jgi:salicylate hydroxylase
MGSLGPEATPLKVIIVGAGLGGCATALALCAAGFSVTIYEKVRKFDRLGDSLGLGENALKLLDRWSPGLREDLVEIGNKSKYMQIRRWHDGKLLARQELMDMAGFIGHRGDYHDAFLRAVKRAGVPLFMGREVVSYDDVAKPRIHFADGTIEDADIIVAADGIKSAARERVLGFTDKPKSSVWKSHFARSDQHDKLTKMSIAGICVLPRLLQSRPPA